ncbi:hypothetical protein D6853_08655 [Butyrivibrio sp. X503]|uniref:GerMN domain-containing protein n=1 Tax=Butyrivibrio sp. X503 TaxID=2364878 RepID=UPI000EA8A0E2|nr:GerMN domain-containing protein [Butyrivibrio sp. X503]RKM55616.1 hypothetical protein D6853_08655 [Butyrivibrio sp. X503]
MIFAKRGLYNRIAVICGVVVMALSSVSCYHEKSSVNNVKVYYIAANESKLDCWDSDVKANTIETEEAVRELLDELSKDIVTSKSQPAISDSVRLKSFTIDEDVVNLDFYAGYKDLGRIEEVLHRAAIVRTLTQLKKIECVSISVEGEPITDHLGNPVGNMRADDFIYNIGNEIGSYEQLQIKLYFVNESNDKLVPVYRTVVYNSSASVEKMAVEQIVKGPRSNEVFPTISPDTKVINLSIKDGVCHIDFSKDFLSEPFDVDPQLALYSIVNTVTEFPSVDKVEIQVDGQKEFTFREFLISGEYERNMDLVQ